MAEKIVKDSQGLAKDLANDCISRQAAIEAVHKSYDMILDFKTDGKTISSSIEDILSNLPSAQPERKRGKWIRQDNKGKPLYGWYQCSRCGAVIGGKTNFCSECGKDMREVDDERPD